MTTSTPPDNTVLVLSPPMVNGQTEGVVGAHIGLRLAVYDLIDGAIVLIDPPLSGTMDPGDIMELWLENELAVLDSKTIEDPDVRTTLLIPKGRLHPDKVNKLYYTVRRGSSNIGTSTPPLEILYNRIRPGLKDRLTDPGGHSELKLLLPDEIKNGVGPDFVSAEVCVAYPYCRAYDVITLKCNGELLEPKPKVNPNQAPQPPNPGDEVPITICFTITRAFLDKAKRLNKKLDFIFSVTDQIGNGPDTDAPWSAVHTVSEDLDGTLLNKPILLERKEDYPGDDASIIDLEKLGNNNLLMVVLTKDPRIEAGDEIVATYTATDTGQPTDVVEIVRGNVEEDPFIGKLPCFLEVDRNKVFAGSKVTADYEVHRPGVGLVGSSNKATAVVIGTAPIDLPPPTLTPPTVPIDVLANPNGVKLQIKDFAAQKDDKALFIQVNAPVGAPPFSEVDFVDGLAEILLSAAFLAAWHGEAIEFRWDLIRAGMPAGESPASRFDVMKIADGDPRLSTPNIAGETGHELDIISLADGAKTRIDAWAGIKRSQCLWLRYFVEGNPTPISTTYNGTPLPPEGESGGVNPDTPVADLKRLANGIRLWIEFKVTFDGSIDESKATTFPGRLYIIRARPSFEDFENANLQSFLQGVPFVFSSGLVFTLISGAAYTTVPKEMYPRDFGNRTLLLYGAGSGKRFRFNLSSESSYVSFIVTGHDRQVGSVVFKDRYDQPVKTLTLPITGYSLAKLECRVTGTSKISYFELSTSDDLYIDQITWSQID